MDDQKRVSPYRGCWIVFLLLIGVPLAFYLIIEAAISFYQPQFARLNPASARAIGCGLGSIFHMSCIVGGILREPWRALCSRVKEFFANLPCGIGFALTCYWEDLKNDGALFIPYMAIIGVCLYFAIDGAIIAISLL